MTARIRQVQLGIALAAAGALLGALCGLVPVVAVGVQRTLRPRPDDAFVSLGELAPYLAGVGALCGALLIPTLALGCCARYRCGE
jgi:hypothetical protein